MNGSGRGGRGGGGGRAGAEDPNKGRLAKFVTDPKLAESANMRAQAMHDPGLVQISASLTKDQSPDAVRDAIFKAIQDVTDNPPSAADVERIRTQLLQNLENTLANAQQNRYRRLNEAIAQGDWRLMFLRHDRLKDVQSTDVVRVAKAYFKPSNRTVGYYIPDMNPDRTVVPAAPDLDTTLKNYKSTMTITQAETFDPTIANIESRLVKSRLTNGMKVDVLTKKTANNMVTGSIELRFGDTSSLVGRREAATFASSMLMNGTKSHTRAQLAGRVPQTPGAGQRGRRGRRWWTRRTRWTRRRRWRRQHEQRDREHFSAPAREFQRRSQAGGRNPERAALPGGRLRRFAKIAPTEDTR